MPHVWGYGGREGRHLCVPDVPQFRALDGAEYAVTVIRQVPDGTEQVAAFLDPRRGAAAHSVRRGAP